MQENLQQWFQQLLPEALVRLKSMVDINSFTANTAGVNQLGQLTACEFEPLGFSSQFIPSSDPAYGAHLILTRPGKSTATIGLISHLDTVFPPEEERKHEFHWRRDGNRIYGPGIIDIKGGTTMIHLVLSALQSWLPEAFETVTWKILLNASEEVLSDDFGGLCLHQLGTRPVAALVFEPGGRTGQQFTLVTQRKGRATFRVTVKGQGAHAGSQHQRGANAILEMSRLIQQIEGFTDYSRDLTFNVGTVTGGTVVNRVPHLAQAEVEMRAFSRDVYQDGLNSILNLNRIHDSSAPARQRSSACQVHVELTREAPPWPGNEPTNRLFALWKDTAREIGVKLEREERGGLSDGNFLCLAIPTLDGLGPCGGNVHCSETSADGSKLPEYLEVNSLIPKATLNTLALDRLIQSTR